MSRYVSAILAWTAFMNVLFSVIIPFLQKHTRLSATILQEVDSRMINKLQNAIEQTQSCAIAHITMESII